jgi:hypothetical protein
MLFGEGVTWAPVRSQKAASVYKSIPPAIRQMKIGIADTDFTDELTS